MNYFVSMKTILLGAACLALAACGSKDPAVPETPAVAANIEAPAAPAAPDTSTPIESDFSRDDFSPKLATWVGLKLGMDSNEVETIARERFGETIEGEGGMSVSYDRIYQTRGRTIFIVTQEGALDDSIKAQQLYAEFIPDSPMTNKLEYFGLRQKCQRGENKVEWTTELCP